MPRFSAITLDSLLEPDSTANSRPPIASPSLYTTPAVTHLPDSPSSFPPSPYIVNHKRRGPRLQKPPTPSKAENVVDSRIEAIKSYLDESLGTKEAVDPVEEINSENGIAVNEEPEDFLDFLDSTSSASNLEGDDGSAVEQLRNLGSEIGEYYDACDELSSDSGSRLSFRKAEEDEIREMRLNLLMEIEKRKQAEDAVENLHIKWQNLRRHLSAFGLVLADLPKSVEEEAIVDPAEDLSQQIVVTRVISASVARGYARAVAEMEMEPQIEAKNFEIARLLDRLRYYEAINREMSQRNQEAVEMARQRRHRRNRRKKWLWGSVGLAVTLGSAAIAWSYFPSSETPAINDED